MKVSSLSQSEYLARFQTCLEERLTRGEFALKDAMLYATLDGGKRVRPLCVYFGARAIGDAELDDVLSIAYAVEMVHSYSLVHDDLPSMDNDDFRRGKPTVHKKFGEANGVLTGDALLTESARHLIRTAEEKGKYYLSACDEILLGAQRMVNGQVKDLAGCANKEEYFEMYADKTGALIVASMRAGAILAGANEDELLKVTEYAEHLGLAFQLADDLLDDDGEPSVINAIGREETQRILKSETASAIEIAKTFANAEELTDFAEMLCVRQK